jgi:hypothetical protein
VNKLCDAEKKQGARSWRAQQSGVVRARDAAQARFITGMITTVRHERSTTSATT